MRSATALAKLPKGTRNLHASSIQRYPRGNAKRTYGIPAPPLLAKTGQFLDVDERLDEKIPYEERMGHGSSSAGHLLLQQQRHMLKYMRLIEHDMPKLVKLREPFTPPPSNRPLVVRTIDYGGEEHPVTAKRTVVVPVARLPLHGPDAIHTFKLLAGTRWTPYPPADAGIGPNEGKSEHGYFKISCEDFPQPGMNLKWVSDTLDRLIEEANRKGAKFASIPLDTRHVKKGSHATLNDFPAEWLPATAAPL